MTVDTLQPPAAGGADGWCRTHDAPTYSGRCEACDRDAAPTGPAVLVVPPAAPVMPAAAPAAVQAPGAPTTAPGPNHRPNWFTDLVERAITAAANGKVQKIEARRRRETDKINARAALVQAKTPTPAPPPGPGDDATGDKSEHGSLPWPVMLVFIPVGIVFYLVFYAIATLGQGLAISNPQIADTVFGHLGWDITLGVGMGIGGVLEFASLFFLLFAIVQRIAGERAYSATIAGYFLAVVSIGLNVFGHAYLGDQYGTIMFGGASLIAFTAGALVAEFIVRQIQIRRGIRNFTPPPYPLRYWRTDRDRVLRARDLFRADPALGMEGSWDAALQQRQAEEQEATSQRKAAADAAELEARIVALTEVLRLISHLKYPKDPALAEIWFLRNNIRVMAERLIERTDAEESLAEIEGLMAKAEADLVAERRDLNIAEYIDRRPAAGAVIGSGDVADNDPNAPAHEPEWKPRSLWRKGAEFLRRKEPNPDPESVPNTAAPAPEHPGPNTPVTPVDNGRVRAEQSVPRDASELQRTVEMPIVNGDREALRAETEKWLLGLLAEGKRAPGKHGITYSEIERRLGFNPDVSGGKNGKAFYAKTLGVFNDLEAEAKEGVLG